MTKFRARFSSGAELKLRAQTVHTITQGGHRIEIYLRPDGSFGYRCEYLDHEPGSAGGWRQFAPATEERFPSQERALQAAHIAARRVFPQAFK